MNATHARCIELLIDRATHDLSESGRGELEAILHEHPEWDDDGFELVAASLDLVVGAESHALPDRVYRKLTRTAHAWLAAR